MNVFLSLLRSSLPRETHTRKSSLVPRYWSSVSVATEIYCKRKFVFLPSNVASTSTRTRSLSRRGVEGCRSYRNFQSSVLFSTWTQDPHPPPPPQSKDDRNFCFMHEGFPNQHEKEVCDWSHRNSQPQCHQEVEHQTNPTTNHSASYLHWPRESGYLDICTSEGSLYLLCIYHQSGNWGRQMEDRTDHWDSLCAIGLATSEQDTVGTTRLCLSRLIVCFECIIRVPLSPLCAKSNIIWTDYSMFCVEEATEQCQAKINASALTSLGVSRETNSAEHICRLDHCRCRLVALGNLSKTRP